MNNTKASATGLSPIFLEKGRHPLAPLDMLQIVKAGNAREEINEFVSRMWSIDDQVAEKLRMTDAAYGDEANAKRRKVDPRLRVGSKCWLSTKGITMPWDKQRKSMELWPGALVLQPWRPQPAKRCDRVRDGAALTHAHTRTHTRTHLCKGSNWLYDIQADHRTQRISTEVHMFLQCRTAELQMGSRRSSTQVAVCPW